MAKPERTAADRWVPGDWNIDCSMCGAKMKAGDAVQNWQGMWRHVRCDEPRHPQDFVTSLPGPEMVVPFTQHLAETYEQICTFNGMSAIPYYALPGCAIPGRTMVDDSQWSPDAQSVYILTEDGMVLLTENGQPFISQGPIP